MPLIETSLHAPPPVLVYVCRHIYIYNSIPPSWPENNLPKQVTRQDFHLHNISRNDLELISGSCDISQMLLTHSKKTKTKKPKRKQQFIKTQQKEQTRKKSSEKCSCANLQPFDVIHHHLQKKKKKQIKLDLGVQMQHCVNACNQTSSVRNNRGRGEH